MTDPVIFHPVANLGNAVRPAPPAPVQDIAKPAGSSASGAANENALRNPHAPRHVRERPKDPDIVLTGPPPSFQASILEVEANFDAIMRRLAAARDQAEKEYGGRSTLDTDKSAMAPDEAAAPEPTVATPSEDAANSTAEADDATDQQSG